MLAAGGVAGWAPLGVRGAPLAPQKAVAAASARTSKAGTVRVSRSIVWLDAAGKPVATVTSEGVIDFEHNVARLDTPSLAMTEIYANGMRYWHVPHVEDIAKKRWVKTDVTKFAGTPGAGSLVGLRGPQGSDPSQDLRQLDKIVQVVEVGREQVRGIATGHYKGSITITGNGGGQQDQTAEAWIDGQGRIRRIRHTVNFKMDQSVTTSTMVGQGSVAVAPQRLLDSLPGEAPTSIVTTTEFYDFGVKVDVQVPPDSDAIRLEDLLSAPDSTLPRRLALSDVPRPAGVASLHALGLHRIEVRRGDGSGPRPHVPTQSEGWLWGAAME